MADELSGMSAEELIALQQQIERERVEAVAPFEARAAEVQAELDGREA